MKKKIIYIIIISISIAIISYFGSSIGTSKFVSIKKIIPKEVKNILNKTIFIVPNLKKEINRNRNYIEQIDIRQRQYANLQSKNGYLIEDLAIKDEIFVMGRRNPQGILNNLINDIELESEENISNFSIKKFVFNANFISGESNLLNDKYPRTPGGYLAQDSNNVFITSGKGTINFFKMNELQNNKINLNILNSNLLSFFVNDENYFLNHEVGVRDILIDDNHLYLSFNNKVRNDCYNIEIVKAKLNYTFLDFKKFYTYPECIEISKIQKFFVNQSGGRLEKYKDNKILFSTGSMRAYYNDENAKKIVEQSKDSKFGKVISIDIETGKDELFTMGHRNPQGLLYDSTNNIVLETEHGPQGGDEINLLEMNKNYGWPISSYGVHYDGKQRINAPLHKSHSDYGFEEPLKYWTPGIGISQLTKSIENKNEYLISSMKNRSIHILKINPKDNKINNYRILHIGQRIRDIISVKEKKIYILFLEDPSRIALLRKI
jgi:hypothetical protein